MSPARTPWSRVALITLVPLCVLGLIFGLTATTKVAEAEDAAADLDGIYSLAVVAPMEGALHEEGTLAMAYGIGFVEDEEFAEVVATTDEARVALLDEITYYDPSDPIGAALIAIDDSLDALPAHREAVLAGTLDVPAGDVYRTSIDLTTASAVPISERLIAPPSGSITLLALDETRRASSDAVMFAIAVIAEGGNPEEVGAALARVEVAEDTVATSAPAGVVESLSADTAHPDAVAAREGVELIAAGEIPDLFVWADVAAEWPIAYVDTLESEIEAGLAILEPRAAGAEDAAIRYLVIGGAASLFAVVLAALLIRRLNIRRPEQQPVPAEAAASTA